MYPLDNFKLNNYSVNDYRILGKTIYGEARGSITLKNIPKKKGNFLNCVHTKPLEAIAHVVKNRSKLDRFKGSVADICRQKWQFSCWNTSDPNYKVINDPKLNDPNHKNPIYELCLTIAEKVLDNDDLLPDCTLGADHYHSIFIDPPYWADQRQITVVLGNHIFYKIGE